MEQTKTKVSKTCKSEVVYLDLGLLKKLSKETKERVLDSIKNMNLKVYTSDNASDLLRRRGITIHRFGVFPTGIESKLNLRGLKIISGNF